ncbi:MAG: hypothetical protein APR54_05410 [Candidatus Cloacimonas sp. SDB]|nr:MAG: hypothetical protein APR54_05410 [Candidatus Cloacimonas sp. SDB]
MKKILIPLIVISMIIFIFVAKNKQLPEKELINEAQLYSVLWHQTAAEYHALSYQAYNLATLRLNEDIARNQDHPKAVIVDVDETVLNNSAYNAREMLGLASYPQGFYDWIAEAEGSVIPGALEFLKYADDNGYEIFYITNRNIRGKEGTIRNLLKYDFPQADTVHVLCKEENNSKQNRREMVAENYEIVLLIGDNLIDFSEVFKNRPVAERFEMVEKFKTEFGKKFIMLPNSMHGEWLKALIDYDRSQSDEIKLKKMLNYLRTE